MSTINTTTNPSTCSTFKPFQGETPLLKKAPNVIGQVGSFFGNSSNRNVVVRLNGVQVNYDLLQKLVQLQKKDPTKMQPFLNKHFANLSKGKNSEEKLRVILDTHLMFLGIDKNVSCDSIRLSEGHTYLGKLNEMLKNENAQINQILLNEFLVRKNDTAKKKFLQKNIGELQNRIESGKEFTDEKLEELEAVINTHKYIMKLDPSTKLLDFEGQWLGYELLIDHLKKNLEVLFASNNPEKIDLSSLDSSTSSLDALAEPGLSDDESEDIEILGFN